MARDLIVFGEDWGGLPSSTQHLVRHLATDRRVLWINSIGLRQPRIGWHDARRAWTKLRRAAGRRGDTASASRPPFRVINPMTIPAPRSAWQRSLAAAMLARQLRPVLAEQGMHDPIMWTSLPTAVDVAARLGDPSLVYYCGDDFAALAGVDHDTVARHESELLRRADLVIAASDTLMRKHAAAAPRLLTHGVDVALFSLPAARARDLPADGRPIAGFYGSISEWLDIDLLCEVVARLPEWHFVFIGRAVIDTRALQRFANVRFLGERPHASLPGYSQHWHASLLPFRDNEQIRACNPLKLREYLAAGRPVVTTAFPAIADYREHVDLVDNADAMIAALQRSRSAGPDSARLRAVSDEDWAAKAQRVAAWLEQL